MKDTTTSWSCNILAGVFTAIQTEEVLRIISLVLTLIATTISIVVSIVGLVKKAKADGKITSDEWEEIGRTAKDGIDDITDILKDIEEKKGEENGKDK